jgi:hypothetical protein
MVELNKSRENMNISDYDFHDGYIINMEHVNNKMKISMESAEISDEELKDDIILSNHDTIKGTLHIEGIKNFKINGAVFLEKFVKTYDEGNISSFTIKGNKMILIISWINHAPKIHEETDLFRIEIEGEKIYWENIPSLVNPFW